MPSTKTFLSALTCIFAALVMSALLYANPDFDVHPRTIEHNLRDREERDTLRIDNVGDELLTWNLEVIADVEGWIEADVLEGEAGAGGYNLVVIKQDGRDLDDGDFYADLHFTSNDHTRREYTVPVADHTVAYPRIGVWWNDGWGYWWGVDMNNALGEMFWGNVYNMDIWIYNPGTARLEVEDLQLNNGYFEMSPAEFGLDADGWQQIWVTFSAEEVGDNAATANSVSNAWDPRELNFRIVANVKPVFRLAGKLPDLTLNEDVADTLLADLDTVFIASDRGRQLAAAGAGMTLRIENSGELFLRPWANWNGVSQVVVTATLGDSVLADTFQVTVLPVPDLPSAFDLTSPSDGDTISYDLIGDPPNSFIWQSSHDPDGDQLTYVLSIRVEGADSAYSWAVGDTAISQDILLQIAGLNNGGQIHWTVSASDSLFTRNAWSSFTNYLIPSGVNEPSASPDVFNLIEVYPNPFNATLSITLNNPQRELTKVEVLDIAGRTITRLFDGFIPAGANRRVWTPQGLPNGVYRLRVELPNRSATVSVIHLK